MFEDGGGWGEGYRGFVERPFIYIETYHSLMYCKPLYIYSRMIHRKLERKVIYLYFVRYISGESFLYVLLD